MEKGKNLKQTPISERLLEKEKEMELTPQQKEIKELRAAQETQLLKSKGIVVEDERNGSKQRSRNYQSLRVGFSYFAPRN